MMLTMIDVDGVGQADATLTVVNLFTVQIIVQRINEERHRLQPLPNSCQSCKMQNSADDAS